jgi:hypothetical protein
MLAWSWILFVGEQGRVHGARRAVALSVRKHTLVVVEGLDGLRHAIVATLVSGDAVAGEERRRGDQGVCSNPGDKAQAFAAHGALPQVADRCCCEQE